MEQHEIVQDISYKARWGSKIGKDCVSLNDSLAKWLSKRLIHLALHTTSYPEDSTLDSWKAKLIANGIALDDYVKLHTWDTDERDEIKKKAKAALFWVAENFDDLWV